MAQGLEDRQINTLELFFTAGGRLLAAGIADKRLTVWDVTGKPTERQLGTTSRDFNLVKFRRDGRLLALCEGYTVRIWDLASLRELPTLNVPNNGSASAQQVGGLFAGFSDDGRKVATGGFGTQTLVWDTETGKQLLRMS